MLFSLRRVRAGEELTLDYQFHDEAEEIPCRCGSAKCRGTINIKSKALRS
jgi:SET domain-containing protein